MTPEEFAQQPPPPPPPEVMVKQKELEIKAMEAKTKELTAKFSLEQAETELELKEMELLSKIKLNEASATDKLASAEAREEGTQLQIYQQAVAEITARREARLAARKERTSGTTAGGRVPGMAAQPGNADGVQGTPTQGAGS